MRRKIWCAFANKGTLSHDRGDSIGEMRVIKMLSHSFDVYYNGSLVSEDDTTFGSGETIVAPNDEYDLYYVRANHPLFKKLPHPKICMAYPYNEEAFRCADGLVVTTDIWKTLLQCRESRSRYGEFYSRWYPEDAFFPDRVVQFKQICDPSFFVNCRSGREIDVWRYKLTNTTTLGFYGRLDVSALPYTIMQALDLVADEKRPLLVFAGKLRPDLEKRRDLISKYLHIGEVSYRDMPFLLSATSCTLAGEEADSEILGSNKVLDSVSRGVPVICHSNQVRREYLGEDYPGLFDSLDGAVDRIEKFASDDAFRQELLTATTRAAQQNDISKAAHYTSSELAFLGSAT